jgi:hypothetical protein
MGVTVRIVNPGRAGRVDRPEGRPLAGRCPRHARSNVRRPSSESDDGASGRSASPGPGRVRARPGVALALAGGGGRRTPPTRSAGPSWLKAPSVVPSLGRASGRCPPLDGTVCSQQASRGAHASGRQRRGYPQIRGGHSLWGAVPPNKR